jgi:heterotetrameric sarcosine oxidase gamma subunit
VSEHTLAARSPFASLTPATGELALGEGVSVRCVGERACVSVLARRGRAAELRAAARTAFGIELPARAHLAAGDAVSFLWAGRDAWTAIARELPAEELEAKLRAAFADAASLVDQSDSRSSIELAGPRARTILSRLAPIDLHPRVFQVGDTALTLLGAVNGQITLLDATPSFELTVSRAFAASFWESLHEAAIGLLQGESARAP